MGICQDIISASEEGEEEDNRTESDSEHKSNLSERENIQNGDDDQEVDVGEIANKDEKTSLVESEKEKSSSKPALLTEEIMSSGFQVSATTDPFGL